MKKIIVNLVLILAFPNLEVQDDEKAADLVD